MAVKKTLLDYFFENYNNKKNKTALREKDYGIWKEISWTDYFKKVSLFAVYLEKLGVKNGDTVAIIGDNKPEWIISEFAAQLVRAYPVGVYQDSVAEEVEYLLTKTKAKVVIAENQEQVDKVLQIAEKHSFIEKIIYYDKRGMYLYNSQKLEYFGDIVNKNANIKGLEKYFENKIKTIGEDDIAVMCTTSGTTSKPKVAILTHRNLIFMSESLAKADPKYESDEFVSFLPLPWIGEQMMSAAGAQIFGFVVNFPESYETVENDMREIGPYIIFSPPRVWENMASSVLVKMMDSTKFKNFIFNKCIKIGYSYADLKFQKKAPNLLQKVKYTIAYIMLFRKLKERLGFRNLRSAMTGGASLGPDTFRFFHAIGVNLKQIYGQTEISGISCIHRSGDIDFTSVGSPIDGTEIKITGDGEIISKNPAVFAGYYNDENATKETLKNGWLYSGDAGYFDKNGKLIVIDRKKDLMYLANGIMFSPQFIENKLKFSPYIKEAVTLGDKRDYVTAILNIDMGITGKWAENSKISYTTYTDLSAKSETYELISNEVEKVNRDLKAEHKIKKFVLLYKELDADDGELTRTRKVRRSFVEKKYKEIAEALYLDKQKIGITASIKLQNGRERKIDTVLKIYFVE